VWGRWIAGYDGHQMYNWVDLVFPMSLLPRERRKMDIRHFNAVDIWSSGYQSTGRSVASQKLTRGVLKQVFTKNDLRRYVKRLRILRKLGVYNAIDFYYCLVNWHLCFKRNYHRRCTLPSCFAIIVVMITMRLVSMLPLRPFICPFMRITLLSNNCCLLDYHIE